MENDFNKAISLLKQGQAPGNAELLNHITVGINGFINFIEQRYFSEYISLGGSKIKFVTGKKGSGKTHFLQLISIAAKEQGFVTVNFSARDIWLHDFKEIYSEIFKKSDIVSCLIKCAEKIATELGCDYEAIPSGMTFVDYLSSIGEYDAIIKKEIRNQLRTMFLKNPLIDNNFAIACSLITGGILGHPVLEASNKEVLLAWMSCDKDVKLSALRGLGLSPSKITKYNARHMLRSLAETHKLAGIPGIIVTIDNADILINSSSLDVIRYTKLKREDAYEGIRELIDEIDTLRSVMFFYAFDRDLIDNEQCGIKSYQALWMRIQNEIVSSRFNSFTDIIDLDKLAGEMLDKETIVTMSERIAASLNMLNGNTYSISAETAEKLLEKSSYTNISLPRKIVLATANMESIWEEEPV